MKSRSARILLLLGALLSATGLISVIGTRARTGPGSPPSTTRLNAASSYNAPLPASRQLRGPVRLAAPPVVNPFDFRAPGSNLNTLLVPNIMANKVATLAMGGDVNSNGFVNPGDTLLYTVTITNNGADPATGVSFTDMLSNQTALVGGSLTVTPIAVDDSYDTIGNTQLQVAASQTIASPGLFINGNVLSNDINPGSGTLTVTAITNGPTTQGGTVTMNTDGTFIYTPDDGDANVADTFTYTVTGTGGATATATVTINIVQRVWYVKNDAAGGGQGRSGDPFNMLSSAQTASFAGDTIYVFTGNGMTTGQNAGITLKGNQRLIGNGVQLDMPVSVNGGPNPTVLRAAGTAPSITNTLGDGVTVTNISGVLIRGFIIGGNTNAIAASFNAAGGVIISDNTITGGSANAIDATTSVSGGADVTINNNLISGAGTEGIDINGAGSGTLNLSLHDNMVTATGNGIDIQRTAGSVNVTAFDDNVVTGNTGGTGIILVGTGATILFDANPGTAAFDTVTGGTTLIGQSGNGVGAAGLVLSNIRGDLSFSDLDIFADGGTALLVDGTSSNYTGTSGTRITASTNTPTLSSTGGAAANLTEAAVNLVLNSLTSTNSGVQGVRLLEVSGTFSAPSGSTITNATGADFLIDGNSVASANVSVTYGGTITDDVGTLVQIQNVTASSTHSFSGLISDNFDGDGGETGISLTGNTGANITFSGGINIRTTTNPAFTSTGAANTGTLTITDPAGATSNKLQTTTGTALNVANTIIGASGLTFESISASGAANGIVLNTTGASGGLTVTGNGGSCTSAGTCTGGAIQNSTGNAVQLTSTAGVSLTRLFVGNSSGHGINTSAVNGLTLTSSYIDDSGDADNEYGLNLVNPSSGSTVAIDGTTFNGAADNLVYVTHTGTLTFNVSNSSSFSYPASVSGTANSAILLEPSGAGSITASIQSSTFTNIVSASAQIGSNTAGANGTHNFTFSNNTINITLAGRAGGVVVSGQESTTTNITINGNNFSGAGGNGVISFDTNDSSIVKGTANNNMITNPPGVGIFCAVDEAGKSDVTLDGNTITNSGGDGIQTVNFGGAGVSTMDMTITNNLVNGHSTSLDSGVRFVGGIGVFALSAEPSAGDLVCAVVRGNTVTGTPAGATHCGGAPCVDYYIEETAGQMTFEEVPNTAATTLNAAYVNSINDAGPVSVFGIIDLTNGGTCNVTALGLAEPLPIESQREGDNGPAQSKQTEITQSGAKLSWADYLNSTISYGTIISPQLRAVRQLWRPDWSAFATALSYVNPLQLFESPAVAAETPPGKAAAEAEPSQPTSQLSAQQRPTAPQERKPAPGQEQSPLGAPRKAAMAADITVNGTGSGFTLPAGHTVTITYKAVVNAGTTATSVTNAAQVSGTNFATQNFSATTNVIQPPNFTKAFSPATIATNTGVSTLTFTLVNPNPSQSLSSVVFTDSLPGGVEVAAVPMATTSGCGAPTFAPAAGNTSLSFSGGTIAGGGTCTVSVNVRGTTEGTKNNTSSTATSTQANASSVATSALTVINAPTFTKSFMPSSINPNGTSALSFTITNNSATSSLTGVGFTDTLPNDVVVASPNGLPGSCGGGTITATPGTNTISLAGATLGTGGNCTFSVNVTAPTPGSKMNSVNLATTELGSNSATATATLTVIGPPTVAKGFLTSVNIMGATEAGNTVTITTIAPHSFTTGHPVTIAGVTPAGYNGTFTITGTTGTTFTYTNPTAGLGAGTGGTATSDVASTSILLGANTTMRFVITNPNSGTALTGIGFQDALPAGISGVSATTPQCSGTVGTTANSVTFSNGMLAAGAICTVDVTVQGAQAGAWNNKATNVVSLEGGAGADSNTATLTVIAPPSIAKAFSPNPIALGGVSTLTFTVTNPNASTTLTGVAFTDTFPAGLQVAATPSASTSGCGSPTFAPAAGNTSLSFSGGTIAASGTCTVTVNVTATTAGAKVNTTGNVTSTNGGTGNTGTDTLTVIGPPSIAKAFSPNPIALGGVSTLTFTVTNSNTGSSLTGVAFTDTFPAGLQVAATPSASTSGCGAPTFAPAAGNTSLSFSGGTIAASGTCTVTVNVTATTAGPKVNTTGNVTSTNGGTGNTGTDTLTVIGPPSIAKAFSPNPIAVGGVSTLTFTVTNSNTGNSLTGVAFTDTFPAGLQVAATPSASTSGCGSPTFAPAAGNTSLSFSGGTITASGTCTVTVNVTATTAGPKVNTTGNVTSTNGGTGNTGTDTLTVIGPPSIAKAFSPNAIAVGGVSTLTFTITNSNTGSSLTGVAFTDTFPAGLQVAATPSASTSGCGAPTFAPAAGNTSVSFSGGTIAASGTCTVTVNVTATTAGAKVNTTGNVTSTNGGTGNTGTATLTVGTPPNFSKAFSPTPIKVGDTSTLTFTISNPSGSESLSGISFSDSFPAGVEVDATPMATNTGCGGTFTANPAATSVSFSGGSLAASGSCTLSVKVKATSAGAKMNTTDPISATESGPGATASATLNVFAAPTIAKSFGTTATIAASPTGAVEAGNTVTITTTAAHGFSMGQVVVISGVALAGYNGTFTITSAAGTTFTYTNPTSGLTPSGGGTATVGTRIQVNGTSTLTITITNPASNPGGLTGISVSDTFPAGVEVDTTPAATNTCGGTFSPAATNTSITLSGGAIATPGNSCAISVKVKATSVGAKLNTTGNVNSTEGGMGGTASATLNVFIPPTIAKAFSPTGVQVGGISTLTITITNPAANPNGLSGLSFTDTFPAGLEVDAAPMATNTCGGTFTAVAAATSISLTGGAIASAGGSCAVSVKVKATTTGQKTNNVIVNSTEGGMSLQASATLNVAAPPVVTKSFSPTSIAVGGTSTLTISFSNPNAFTLSGLSISDSFPAGLEVDTTPMATNTCGGTFAPAAGNTSISLSGGSLAVSPGSCSISVKVKATTGGAKLNTTGNVSTTESGAGGTGSATLNVFAPPTITKAFAPTSIALNGISTLTITITNPASNPNGVTGVAVSDSFPAGVEVDATPMATNTCGGTFAPAAGNTSISLTGGAIATAGGSCAISVKVKGTSAGAKLNTTGNVSSTQGGTGLTASATLNVFAPPTITKAFAPTSIALNGISTLTITITNPASNPNGATGVAVSDNFPAGVQVDTTPMATNTCGGTFAPAAGNTSISLTGGAIATAGGSCAISVKVKGTTVGVKNNTTGNVSSTQGGTGLTASAPLTVAAAPTINKAFGAASIQLNASTSMTFTINNPNASLGLTGISFTDTLPAGLVVATPNGLSGACGGTVTAVAGSGSVSLTGGSLAGGGNCTITLNVTGTTGGNKPNTTGAISSNESGAGATSNTATVNVVAPPSISKQFAPASILTGGTSTLTFTLTNPAANTVALTGVAFTDNLPAGVQVASPNNLSNTCGGTATATAGTGAISLTGGTINTNSTCMVVANVTATSAGTKNNVSNAVTSTNGGTGNTASATLTVTCPAITVNPATLPNGGVGVAYPATNFSASGGGGTYTFSVSSGTLPAGLNLTGATLSGTPTEGGTFNITIKATDQFGCMGTRDYTLVINRPPVLAPIGNKSVPPGQTLTFTAMATDPDPSDILTYSLVGAPAGATINPSTGQFSWTPTMAQIGMHTFTVKVTDNGNPQLSDSETITVNVSNLPPTLTLSVSYLNTNPTNVGLSAQLKDAFTNNPIPGKIISFTIGTQTVTGTTDGNGVAMGQIQVAAPGTYAAKAAFAGDANYPMTMTVTSFNVTLGGQSCTFARTPASQSFAASGGTGTVALTTPASNCNWSAASTVPWITLTSGLGGTGNGTVGYTVASNPTTAPRSGTINIAGLIFTVVQGMNFADVPLGHPFYTEIGKLAARGVTLGCGGGNYCPDANVTREQMAAFIIRGLGDFNPPPPAMQRFADVPPANPFYAFIEQMAVRQITLGCGGGNYCPTQNVTREAMAAFIIRALHAPGYIPPTPAMQRFLDVPPPNPFYAHIEEMAVRNITQGCGGGNYCPTALVTRAQMAVFLVRAFGL